MASTVSKVVMEPSDAEDSSDEKMEELLAQATKRLREKEASQRLAKTDSNETYTFPKLDAGKLEKSYTATENGIARVDSSRLLEEKDRKQANTARMVEEPVAAKKQAAQVCLNHFTL